MTTAQAAAARLDTSKTGAPVSAPADKNAYTSHTWWYDVRGFGILTFAYQDTLWRQIRFFEGNLRTAHLEVAVGTGTLFQMVLKKRRRAGTLPQQIVGLDYSEEMLDGAKRRFRKDPNVTLLQGTVCEMPYKDGSFDSVNIANALHCFSDVAGALREVKRVMAPGGTLAVNILLYPTGFSLARRIANAINAWGMKKGILHTPFTEADALAHFTAAGFKIAGSRVKGNCLYVLAQA